MKQVGWQIWGKVFWHHEGFDKATDPVGSVKGNPQNLCVVGSSAGCNEFGKLQRVYIAIHSFTVQAEVELP